MHGTSGTPLQCVIVDRLGAFLLSFIEPSLFYNNVAFDNTSPIYLINPPWKLGLGLGLDLKLHHFSIFSRIIKKTSTLSSSNFMEGIIVLKERTHSIINKMKLYILGVPINKIGN